MILKDAVSLAIERWMDFINSIHCSILRQMAIYSSTGSLQESMTSSTVKRCHDALSIANIVLSIVETPPENADEAT
jgi:hypothetical protein